MRLVSFRQDGRMRVGLQDGEVVADLTGLQPDLGDMVDLIAAGPVVLQSLVARAGDGRALPLEDVELSVPVRPRKNVFAVGRNYIEHVHEVLGEGAVTRSPPDHPIFFTKPPTSVIGPGRAIDISNDPTGTTDYEGELAVVMGARGKHILPETVWEHVFGYSIVNDVTARALQRRHGQWLIGKGPDTFCPMGPCIVTAGEIEDVNSLSVQTTVNGEVRQSGSVADLIFDIPTLISTLSSVMTLEPGDVLATGTPAGVGAGFDPPRWLKAGDVVAVTIDGIGTLENPVI